MCCFGILLIDFSDVTDAAAAMGSAEDICWLYRERTDLQRMELTDEDSDDEDDDDYVGLRLDLRPRPRDPETLHEFLKDGIKKIEKRPFREIEGELQVGDQIWIYRDRRSNPCNPVALLMPYVHLAPFS